MSACQFLSIYNPSHLIQLIHDQVIRGMNIDHPCTHECVLTFLLIILEKVVPLGYECLIDKDIFFSGCVISHHYFIPHQLCFSLLANVTIMGQMLFQLPTQMVSCGDIIFFIHVFAAAASLHTFSTTWSFSVSSPVCSSAIPLIWTISFQLYCSSSSSLYLFSKKFSLS